MNLKVSRLKAIVFEFTGLSYCYYCMCATIVRKPFVSIQDKVYIYIELSLKVLHHIKMYNLSRLDL